MGTSKQSRVTVGKKLCVVFAAMSALALALVCIYGDSSRQSNRVLDTVLHLYNKKLDIGSQVELATTEMQGAQRGLMLSYAMHDPGAAAQYTKLYADSQARIDRMLTELQPVLANDTERHALEQIRSSGDEWAPRFRKLVEICQSGDIAAAYKLRNANKVLSANMHSSATTLVAEQRRTLEAANSRQAEFASMSNWIVLLAVLLSVVFGAAAAAVVRGITVQLRRSIVELHAGTNEVARAAGQIRCSSQSLAQGASNQAASLEETSASSEKMACMTRQNAGNSKHAANFMNIVGQRVVEANRTLDGMMTSMLQIGESSGRISKIVRVIDEIAFQTNILALNAAVEAARAGEVGMGFAVVANEVRNLAQRSAQAAKETAVLIEESILRSSEGNTWLGEVTAAILSITDAASNARKLVDEVEASSREQAQGIEQISKAVSRMDEITQRTAANAEQSASAGEELDAQSHTLLESVDELRTMVGAGSDRLQ